MLRRAAVTAAAVGRTRGKSFALEWTNRGNVGPGQRSLPHATPSLSSHGLHQQRRSMGSAERLLKVKGSNALPFHPRAFAIMALVGGGLVWLYTKRKAEKLAQREKSVGKVAIGGPFTLVDHSGIPVTDSEFRGTFMLVYFGFTFCPDICPAELDKMALALDRLEKIGIVDEVQPIMISVDPWRDTVKQVREYVADFHPRLLGMTGTPEQVLKCAKQYRVYTSRPPAVEGNSELADTSKDYLVDHSVFMYLMDPDGNFLDYFGPDKDDTFIAEKISQRILEFRQAQHSPSLWTRLFQ